MGRIAKLPCSNSLRLKAGAGSVIRRFFVTPCRWRPWPLAVHFEAGSAQSQFAMCGACRDTGPSISSPTRGAHTSFKILFRSAGDMGKELPAKATITQARRMLGASWRCSVASIGSCRIDCVQSQCCKRRLQRRGSAQLSSSMLIIIQGGERSERLLDQFGLSQSSC